ncbi:MAG: hypothetical protein U0930_10745 [Pirellulales bacterium]
MSTAMMGQKQSMQPTIYMLPAILAMKADDPLREIGWAKLVKHLVEAQHEDGSFCWTRCLEPIFNTPPVLTIQVATWFRFVPKQLAIAESNGISESAARSIYRSIQVDGFSAGLSLSDTLGDNVSKCAAPSLELRQLVEQLPAKMQAKDGG